MSKSVQFDVEEESSEEQTNLTIQEEYKLWRKNCKFMYEFVSETSLTWSSLTVQWLPKYEIVEENSQKSIKSNLILGTHTSGEDTDYLKLASTQLPGKLLDHEAISSAESESSEKINSRIKIYKKFENDVEINRARYCPHDDNLIATINGNGLINLYDTANDSNIALDFHKENGYGLAWNSIEKNTLLSGSDDMSIALWDTANATAATKPISVLNAHTDIVNDVKWNNFDSNVFGSVSDDKTLLLFDKRTPIKPVQTLVTATPMLSLAFSYHSQNLLATGGEDSNVSLFDIRNLNSKLHTMMGHSDKVTCLEWSPLKDGIIASGSQDRRIIIWDITKIGEEQQQDDADDGAPELFMMHAGHTGSINDLSWNPYIPWTLASCAVDNIVHLWQVSKKLTNIDVEDVKDSELE